MFWGAATLLLCVSPAGLIHDGLFQAAGWFGILALLGLGRRHLDFHNALGSYFIKASFPIYTFHLPWIVLLAVYIGSRVRSVAGQLALILPLGFNTDALEL